MLSEPLYTYYGAQQIPRSPVSGLSQGIASASVDWKRFLRKCHDLELKQVGGLL